MTLSRAVLQAVHEFCASFSSNCLQNFENICGRAAQEQPGIRCEELFPRDHLRTIDQWILASCDKKDQAARHLNHFRKTHPDTARPCQLVADFGNVQSSWRFLRGLRYLLEHAKYPQVVEAVHLARDQRTSAPNPGRTHRGVSSKKKLTPADTNAARFILKRQGVDIPSPVAGRSQRGGKRASSEPLPSQSRCYESEPESSEAPTPERGRGVTDQSFRNKRRRLSGCFNYSARFEALDLSGCDRSGNAKLQFDELDDAPLASQSLEYRRGSGAYSIGGWSERRRSNAFSIGDGHCSEQDGFDLSPLRALTPALTDDEQAEASNVPLSTPFGAFAVTHTEETPYTELEAVQASHSNICRHAHSGVIAEIPTLQEGQQREECQIAGSEDDDAYILPVSEVCSEVAHPTPMQEGRTSVAPLERAPGPPLPHSQNPSNRQPLVPDTTVEAAFRSFQHGRNVTETGIRETLKQFNPDPEKWLVVEDIAIDTCRPLANQGRIPQSLRASHRFLVVPLNFDGSDSDIEHCTVAFLDRQERCIIVYDPRQDVEYIRMSMRCCEAFASSLPPFVINGEGLQDWESKASDVRFPLQYNVSLVTADRVR